jgi:SpoVK/Ycf46/Vps4 family AAA+-type ATPase
MPLKSDYNKVVDYCRGMTRREIANALSFCLIKDEGKLIPKSVGEIQAKEISSTPGLSIGEYNLTFESLKGYQVVKQFVKGTAISELAKGIMLLGPPGTGKSHFSKCLAAELGLKMIVLEMAELFGSLVGESEKMMKRALEVIKANAPCILFIDEIEKGLSGVSGSNTDGGTTKRSMAQFLKFLSDERPEGIYVIATCNNISALPPEWVRAERWDCAPFFIDLPNKEERKEILSFYQKEFSVKGQPKSMEGWSGAEIKSACRIAAMMKTSIDKVEKFVVPVSKTMEQEITQLRKWAVGKTLPASEMKMNGLVSKGKRSINL